MLPNQAKTINSTNVIAATIGPNTARIAPDEVTIINGSQGNPRLRRGRWPDASRGD